MSNLTRAEWEKLAQIMVTPALHEWLEERAAIAEYDAGMSRRDAEIFAAKLMEG